MLTNTMNIKHKIATVVLFWLSMAQISYAQVLTENLEIKSLQGVGATWQTVNLENSYTDAIVICTHVLPTASDPSATTRIDNITATSFDLRLQQLEDSSAVPTSDVHCIISDEGVYNSGGLKYEAHKVDSDLTNGLTAPNNWNESNAENVTGSIVQIYSAPAVFGQVMSFNDNRGSVFWNFNCITRGDRAFFNNAEICVGKHVGQIGTTRATETLGYIVMETSSATVNDIRFAAAVGADTGAGVGNSPPYNYAVSGDFDAGVLTQAGEDGGQGGWAILFGADPLPNGQVRWAIEEEVVQGDMARGHTSENVAYWLFEDNQVPDMEASKTVDLYTGNGATHMLPGSDVIYSITVENTGSGTVDEDTIVLIDAMPPELSFYNGDIDDGGPQTQAVILIDTDSGLTLGPADVTFSKSATKPANFAACTDSAISGYDPDVTFICLAPKGEMEEGTITPSSFTIQFRAMVK